LAKIPTVSKRHIAAAVIAASDLLTHHGRKEGKSGTKKSP
jgi:hypothetical protein